jgi:phosphoserine phosphatase
MLKLLLIRHGETAWNTAEIFRGRVNVGLSEVGLKQAAQLAEYLRSNPLQAIYCSPLPRGAQTAGKIAELQGLEAQPWEEFNDQSFGEWEGVPRQDVQNRYPEIFDQWLVRPDLARIPGGESLDEASQRAMKGVSQILARHESGTVAIVTHRVITKVLTCALLGLDNSHFWNVEMDTASITTFVHNGQFFVLTRLNDTSFMK